MGENIDGSFSVSIQELLPVHVAHVDYVPRREQADLYAEIHACFQRLQGWAQGLGLDPFTRLHVGIPVVQDGRLSRYECCLEVPPQVQTGRDDIRIKELPGGRYAVVSIAKDPAVIGDSIGRFYQEYVPQNRIEIDGARPTYEIYYESTMEYCVPIL
jgi:DNA gyrase inhibitor GyrI